MGWPLRMFLPEEIYFVTVRCFQRRLLMRPSNETTEVLGGVLARAARLTGVEVFVFAFASNHLHLLVRAPAGNLPRFMQHLLTNISKKLGALVRWHGRFWERRYSAAPVLDEAALLDRVRYILAHGVKEGLVRRCVEWPGLSSLSMLWDRRPRSFRWFNWTRRAKSGSSLSSRSKFGDEWAESETLELAPLPIENLQPLEAMRRFLRDATREFEAQAARSFARVLGRDGVLRQNPHRRARWRKPSRGPRCHTTIRALLVEYLERYRGFAAAFREAAVRWKRWEFGASFPEQAFRPIVWPGVPPGQLAA
ncbi:MAG TPA: transposase [Myxococcaceae bacterium]|nr:transposase [Myxococcaceae bacterium]